MAKLQNEGKMKSVFNSIVVHEKTDTTVSSSSSSSLALIVRRYTCKCKKKLRFIHELTANDASETEKNYKKVILPTSATPKCQCAGE